MSKALQKPPVEPSRLTPWVGRLVLLNACSFLLLQTVLTAPAVIEALEFIPARSAGRPWSFFSYLFVHKGLLHLGGNLLMLLAFGPPLERRMGSRAFLLYYVYCGVGAAALAVGLTSFMPISPLIGASGAGLGLGLAFALNWPEVKFTLPPSPLRVNARALVALLALADLAVALWLDNGVASVAHVGGIGAGYLFFRIQNTLSRRGTKEPKAVARRAVMAPIPVRQGSPAAEVRPALLRPDVREAYPADEVDRVLDKISAFGIQSLTAEERRFLDEVSKKKRKDLH